MIEIMGYWVAVSLLVVPPLLLIGVVVASYADCVLRNHAGYAHRLQWLEKFNERPSSNWEIVLVISTVMVALIDLCALIITTIATVVNDTPRHDFLGFMEWFGETFGAFFGWVIVVLAGFFCIHMMLVGYAKILCMSDKLKGEEKKNV